MIKCIVMFSGGLDSTITVHLLKSMGLDVLALHFVLPFYSAVGNSHAEIKEKALRLSVPLRIEEDGEEYVSMFKDPHFGYGKNINPCIDCRIHQAQEGRAHYGAGGRVIHRHRRGTGPAAHVAA